MSRLCHRVLRATTPVKRRDETAIQGTILLGSNHKDVSNRDVHAELRVIKSVLDRLRFSAALICKVVRKRWTPPARVDRWGSTVNGDQTGMIKTMGGCSLRSDSGQRLEAPRPHQRGRGSTDLSPG